MSLPVKIDSHLLPAASWAALSDLAPELAHAYAVRQIFRTETEARVSVLDDLHFPTAASKWWQAVREQVVMLEQLALLGFEYRRNEAKAQRYARQLAAATDDLAREEAQIDLDECAFRRAGMRAIAADRAREIGMWSQLKAELNDGSFDTHCPDAHQLVSYAQSFMVQAAHAPAQMALGEANNLGGKLAATLRTLKERGLLDQALAPLPPELVALVMGSPTEQRTMT